MTASRQQHPLQVQAESTVSTILDEHEEDGSSESRSDSPQPPQQQTGDGKIDMGESATDYSFDEEAANGLPCCIRQIAWCVFGSMIHPGDDSVTRHRKMVLSWGLGISLVGIFGGLFNLFTVGFSTNAQIVAVIAPFFLALLWIVLYVLARTTSTASAAIADIWIFFTWLGVVAISISWTDWPSDESFILLAIVACLFRTPRIPLHIMLCILGMVLSGYNLSCYSRGAPEYDLWALPDPIMRSFGRRFANSMASMFSALLVIGGLRAQMWESEQQTRHAQEQSRLVSSIANLLSRYDTARAAIVIDDAIRSDAADPEILATFKTLVENLDQYRPHLPNWMLPEAQAAAAAAVNTVPEQQSTDSDELKQLACETIDDELVSISSGTSTPKENREPSSRSTSGRRVSNLTRINSVSVSSASATNNSSTTPTTPHGHATVSANPHLRHGRTPTHTGGQPVVGHVARPAKIAHGVSVTQAVVFAKINFEVRSGATKQADLLNHLVDIVHKHAASTNAAIHSFVGDEITVTWNAAVKTLQADAKAARFLARVQKDVISEGGIAVAGGAFSGHAKVQLAGGMTGKQQQSLSVTADWITALDYLVSVGRRYASILVDPTLRENSSFACHVRAVAALEVPNWATGDRRLGTVSNLPVMVPLRRLGAYEIVDERNEHEDGEWMYVLAKVAEAAGTADTTTAKAIKTATECLDQWLRGDTAIPSVQMMDIDAWLVSQAQHGAKDSAILSEIVQAMRKSGTTTRFVRPDTFRL